MSTHPSKECSESEDSDDELGGFKGDFAPGVAGGGLGQIIKAETNDIRRDCIDIGFRRHSSVCVTCVKALHCQLMEI